MQDQYVGDIGDFAKYGLLRAVSGVPGEVGQKRLGVAWWYVKGNRVTSSSSGDGRLTGYLNAPERWRDLDDELFDALKWLVCRGCRSVEGIEASGVLGSATFHRRRVPADVEEREAWFKSVVHWLNDGDPDIVFADPDNGLYPDDGFRGARAANRKRISPREFRELAEGRTAIVYHHFHRGYSHDEQLRKWMSELPECQYVYRWRAWVPRAFIVITKDEVIERRLEAFAERWKAHGSSSAGRTSSPRPRAPTQVTPTQSRPPDGVAAERPRCQLYIT